MLSFPYLQVEKLRPQINSSGFSLTPVRPMGAKAGPLSLAFYQESNFSIAVIIRL
jgi:hypothetical protein